jgi:hypothetical protein
VTGARSGRQPMRRDVLQRTLEAAHDLGHPVGTFLEMLLLSGVPSASLARARWTGIVLERRIWFVPHPSGGYVWLPLPRALLHLLHTRWPRPARAGFLFGDDIAVGRDLADAARALFGRAYRRRVALSGDSASGRAPRLPALTRAASLGLRLVGLLPDGADPLLGPRARSRLRDPAHGSNLKLLASSLEIWCDHLDGLLCRPDAWPGGKTLPPLA